eukprot:gb/GEZJ01000361.1/.p1 GENE.gb/GEZJ01000361.1/~~gb/GEZJ01000361.1/.p1  ORF type:complete len:540 (-),score=106.72 gb/GEZJ01000361.1/:3457-5076(-)
MSPPPPPSHHHLQQPLPIDIHYNKFLHWLIDRRTIPPKWAAHLAAARTLTRTALAATPDHLRHALQIPQLTAHQNLPYFTVRAYLQTLVSHHLPPHNDVLGRYKSPVLRAWADAAAAFEKRHVYLADAAQLLTHNTNNEATAIKATIARLNQTLADFARREAQLIRSAADADQRYQNTLHHYNLQPDERYDFHSQLQNHLHEQLPLALQRAVHQTRSPHFQACVKYYHAFATYVSELNHSDVCTALDIVMNADIDALTAPPKSAPPAHAVEYDPMPSVEHNLDPSDSAEAPIDWGIEIGQSGSASHPLELPDTTDSSQSAAVTTDGKPDSPPQGEIDWSAVMGELNNSLDQSTQPVEATPLQCVTLLDAVFREQYFNDLTELQAFLAQRQREVKQLSNSEVALALQQSNSAPIEIKSVDIDSLVQMCATVDEAIHAINGADTRKLLAMQSSTKLLERTAKSVLEKKHVAQRTRAAIDVLRKQRAAAVVQLTEETAKMENVAEETRRIIKETEDALSQLYDGRVVNIVGEINVVFPCKSA